VADAWRGDLEGTGGVNESAMSRGWRPREEQLRRASQLVVGGSARAVPLAGGLGHEMLVLAPLRDQLRLVDVTDTEAVLSVLERGLDDYRTEPRRVSPVPYLPAEDKVPVWAPAEDDPGAELVVLAQGTLVDFEYEHQHQVLSELHEQQGQDMAVPAHTLMTAPDGTRWSWGAAALHCSGATAPSRPDRHPAGEAMFSVAWDDVTSIAAEELRVDPATTRHAGGPKGPPVRTP